MYDTLRETLYRELKEIGIKWPEETITLPPEEEERWVALGGKPIWDMWLEKWKDRGPTQEIFNRALELRKELSK